MSEVVSTAPQEFRQRIKLRSGKPASRHSRRIIALLLACTLVLVLGASTFADTHYVSKTGSNTYPYTSWAMATDSVRAAIDAADEWDTVLVGPGEFTADSLPLKRGLAFVGSGMDSTHILHNGTDGYLLILADSSSVEQLHLHGRIDTVATRITFKLIYAILSRAENLASVTDSRFSNTTYGVYGIASGPSHVVVEGCVFFNFYQAVRLIGGSSAITRNTFHVDHNDIAGPISQLAGQARIEQNMFDRTVDLSAPLIKLERCDELYVQNNICINPKNASGTSIRVNGENLGYPSSGIIENNLCKGGAGGIISEGGSVRIRNNIVTGTWEVALRFDTVLTPAGYVGFNLYWDNEHLGGVHDFALLPDSSSLFADPMFVDSLDFHLQAFSPAIDAGDTLLLDPDGSRSDIGLYGGPLGETYTYVDLPPGIPQEFAGRAADTEITLAWRGNHESDFDRYELFRDIFPISTPDSALLLAVLSVDTQYVDWTVTTGVTYYYRMRALDRQTNASPLSAEVVLAATGIDDHGAHIPTTIELRPNFPNPFNTATRIPFVASFGSRSFGMLTISVYDVIGRRVKTLYDGVIQCGEVYVTWNGTDQLGRPIASGAYFVRLISGECVISRKVVLLK